MACPPPNIFMPFGMPSHPPGLVGKTQYNYVTRDGGPPNKGAPPGESLTSAYPPPAYTVLPLPGQLPFCRSAGSFFLPPGLGFPGAYCVPNAPLPPPPPPPPPPAAAAASAAPAPAPGPVWYQPPPPPPPPPAPPAPPATSAVAPPPAPTSIHAAAGFAAVQAPEPPVSGNRVKDRLLIERETGTGYVAAKNNATFHLFTYNVLDKYAVNASSQFYIPPYACEPFRVMTASDSMPIEELIEQLDCIKIAPPGYPRYAIGVAEAFDVGNGWFQLGTKFMLDEERAKLTIKEAVGAGIGEAGTSRPRYLIRMPGKRAGG